MASLIRGITVEIGDDTTKLEQSIKSVNSTFISVQSQLKDVTKFFRIDNVRILGQILSTLKKH